MGGVRRKAGDTINATISNAHRSRMDALNELTVQRDAMTDKIEALRAEIAELEASASTLSVDLKGNG